jgi:hypothetical protein
MAAPCSTGGSFPVLSVTDAWLIPAGDTPYVGFPTQLIQWSKGPTGQCPLWVISGYLHCNGSCPLYPPKADMCGATRECLLWANSGHRTLHSITSLARPRTESGIVKPIFFAVLRFTTKSNFVACSTGRSAGFTPLKILSTKYAARRYMVGRFSP